MAWIKAIIVFFATIAGILAVIALAIAALFVVPFLFLLAVAIVAASWAYHAHKLKKKGP